MPPLHALTLGDLHGSVVIGRPLDVAVTVEAAPEEEVSVACFKAEVFHADVPQASASVTVTPLPGGAGYRVRVQSRALVDEPVVTIALLSTCASTLTRRYVVLADFPVVVMPEPPLAELPQAPTVAPLAATPVAAPVTQAPAPVPAPATTAAAPNQAQAAATTATVAKRQVVPKRKVILKEPDALKPTPVVPEALPAAVAQPGKPALKLEALNLPVGQSDGLASTPPIEPSSQALLQIKQIETLQQELKQLRLQTAKTNAHLAELQVQLQLAQSERVSLQLFYAVLVLLLLFAAALSWLVWQRYRGQPTNDAGPGILGGLQQAAVEPPHTPVAVAVAATPVTIETVTNPSDKPVKSAQSWWSSQSNTTADTMASVAASTPALPVTQEGLAPAFTNTQLQDSTGGTSAELAHDEVDLDIDLTSWPGLEVATSVAAPAAELIQDIRPPVDLLDITAAAPVTVGLAALPVAQEGLNQGVTNTPASGVAAASLGDRSNQELSLDIDFGNWPGLGDTANAAPVVAEPAAQPLAESILDIRQQVELCVSLGQTEHAVQVLKKQIAQTSQPNALLYLDLLSLFHSLGFKADFREYRTEFNRHFNCELPDFPAYHLEGLDLLDYAEVLTRLTQVWNSKEVISYLNACIYRSELALAQPQFELAAMRDLLLLLSIAEQVLEPDPV
ncbi:MAG: hypothetical protein PHH58_03785 [Rhodoferax sp.]|nr:hypothetical protein [Rhodoferax sp.]